MSPPNLVLQTVYAELRDRCIAAAFETAFAEDGSFVSKTVNGRPYWYFQEPVSKGRAQKYVGPETPELLNRISSHRQARDDRGERRALVSTLVRSFGLPRPPEAIGTVISALSDAGVFRLRAVLVGTIAYQTFSAMLGTRLPAATLQTGDIDIAQFANVSVAVEDRIPPPIEILRSVDPSFRDVPSAGDGRKSTAYIAKGGLRVEFLTPNLGSDSTKSRNLAALQTAAEPLRFLDFLIHEPEQAVILHDAGILVSVPQPERYAIHKLIVSQRRPVGSAKWEKDIMQAQILLDVLVKKRTESLRAVWDECFARGHAWREHVLAGLEQIALPVRDAVLKAAGQSRSILPGVDLTFANQRPRYDFERDVVIFSGGGAVRCEISWEALADWYNANNSTNDERIAAFLSNRSEIENMAREKYLNWPIEEPGVVLIRTLEVPKLRKQTGVR